MTGLENMPDFPDLEIEKNLWKKKIPFIAGIDEAGRGAWAGPVTAAAVILPVDPGVIHALYGVRDSKQMTSKQRFFWKDAIKAIAVNWAIGWGTVEEIDHFGILNTTYLAMERALQNLQITPLHLLIDAVRLKNTDIPQTNLIKGDVHVLSISAASVLAKTARDEWMIQFEHTFPKYGFSRHKGYGTAMHRDALARYGPCGIHRRSYLPVKNWESGKTKNLISPLTQKDLSLFHG
jgi:ribonuclease HII